MRHRLSMPSARRAIVAACAAAAVLTFVAPIAAHAVVVPTPTIAISVTSQLKAAQFKLEGRIARSAAGKILIVEVYKPGGSRWSYSSARGITSTGYWMYRYMPRLKGTYRFRARYTTRYGTRFSGVRSMWLKTQPVWDLIVASTTSTSDSGLFDSLVPAFEHQYPYWRVKILSVGSGQAIAYGKSKDADVLLVHDPAAEIDFISGGWGFARHSVMYNDFVLLGPASATTRDRVGVKPTTTTTSKDIVASLNAIRDYANAATSPLAIFVARTDLSGTDAKNRLLWGMTAGGLPVNPPSTWYIGTSAGMGAALNTASAYPGGPAYILADRATFLNRAPSGLAIVCEQDFPAMTNPYSVMQVNGARNAAGAADFSSWIRGVQGQSLIRQYGVYRFGKALFTPWVPPAAGAY